MQFRTKSLYLIFLFTLSLNSANYTLNSGTGYLLTPSATLQDEGTVSLSVSYYEPLNRVALIASPFNWMEASLFYTDINVHRYYVGSSQSYKDKGFNVKFRIKEQDNLPSLAIGFDDIAGTSIFKGEYIVATHKFTNMELSVGYGTGHYGTRGNINNIFRDGERDAWDQSTGGQINFNDIFKGNASLFGGFRAKIKSLNINFEAEYDGSLHNTAIDQIPGFSRYLPKSKFNFGFSKEIGDFSLAISKVKGRTTSFLLNYKKNISKNKSSMLSRRSINDPSNFVEILEKLSLNSIYLQNGKKSADKRNIELQIVQNTYFQQEEVLKELSKTLSNENDVEEIVFKVKNGALNLYSAKSRADRNNIILSKYEKSEYDFNPKVPYPLTNYYFNTSIASHIGSPAGFFFGGLEGNIGIDSVLSNSIELRSVIKFPIFNNFSELSYNPNATNVPQVRTDIQDYLKNNRVIFDQLKINKFFNSNEQYGLLSIGHFEQMFSGIHFEYLYRPFNKVFAAGFEISSVRKRNYDQKLFSFLDYKTTVGHFNFYLMEPKNRILAHLSYGKYLAKDEGYTLDISRLFRNGSSIGLFFTRTNLSPQEFGEGSFDKGVYFKYPLNIFDESKSDNLFSKFLYRPITRDGGSKLNTSERLFDMSFNSQFFDHILKRNY